MDDDDELLDENANSDSDSTDDESEDEYVSSNATSSSSDVEIWLLSLFSLCFVDGVLIIILDGSFCKWRYPSR